MLLRGSGGAQERFFTVTTLQGSLCVPCTNLSVLEDIIPWEKPHCSFENQGQQSEGQLKLKLMRGRALMRQGALSCRWSRHQCSSRYFLKLRLSILNLGGWSRAGRCPFQGLVSSQASPCSGVISAGPESGLDLCLCPGNVCQDKAGQPQSQAGPKSRLQPHGDGNLGWELVLRGACGPVPGVGSVPLSLFSLPGWTRSHWAGAAAHRDTGQEPGHCWRHQLGCGRAPWHCQGSL